MAHALPPITDPAPPVTKQVFRIAVVGIKADMAAATSSNDPVQALALAEHAHEAAHHLSELLGAADQGDSGWGGKASKLVAASTRLLVELGGDHGMDPPPVHGGPFDPLAVTAGTNADDAMTGTTGPDNLSGGDGDDLVLGDAGDDRVWGNMGNDTILGRSGHDMLAGGFGADWLDGGGGDDVLLSRSDAGEPEIAIPFDRGDRITDRFEFALDPALLPHDDTLTGGAGADTFQFEFLIGAKPGQTAIHLRPDGDVDWMFIAMNRNTTAHYHWVDSIGDDVITDFSRAQGDTIRLLGHTVDVDRITVDGADSIIHLISRSRLASPKALAHEDDLLGTIRVQGVSDLTLADIAIDPRPGFGSFVATTDAGVNAHRVPFLRDDTGVLPGQGFHGENPWMM